MKETKMTYYVNNNKVDKNTFYKKLKSKCYDTKHTSYCGPFGIDFDEFNSKKFRKYCRDLNGYNGYAPKSIIFCDNTRDSSFKIEKNGIHRPF